MRHLLHGLLLAGLVAAVLVGALMFFLRPPSPLAVPERGGVLADVTVVNPGRDRHPRQTLTIRGTTIESMADFVPGAAVLPQARPYEGTYVLPGLIDMHVHQPTTSDPVGFRQYMLLYLAYGVTTVRDTGDYTGTILTTRERILAGELAGPRVFTCGPFIDGDPPVWPSSTVVHNAAEAQRVVDELAAMGVHCIKAYQNLSFEALAGLRTAAKRHRLPLIGHVPVTVPLEKAQLDDVQHLGGIPAMEPRPYSSWPEHVRDLISGLVSLNEARLDFVVRTSVEQQLSYTPTIGGIEPRLRVMRAEHTGLSQAHPETFLLPRYWRDVYWKPDALAHLPTMPSLTAVEAAIVLEKSCLIMRRLHEAGVVLHLGTDTPNPFLVPGAALQGEMRRFVECGFTPEGVWAAATWQNAQSLPEPGLGVIQPGAPADLLVFRDDPTRDLAALSSLVAVVADGRFYPKETLDDAVARNRAYFESWLYDSLATAVARLRIAAARRSPER